MFSDAIESSEILRDDDPYGGLRVLVRGLMTLLHPQGHRRNATEVEFFVLNVSTVMLALPVQQFSIVAMMVNSAGVTLGTLRQQTLTSD